MKKICLLNVWIGKLPDSFQLLLRSVQLNPTIDFYFITDQNIDQNLPNVHVIKMSFSEIKQRLEEELQMKIQLKHAYKLCDYKPLWRCLIPELCDQYDFYGHCDFDVIFGDIRQFITDELLDKHDKLFDVGFCTLYRSTEEVINLYKRSMEKDNMAYPYKQVFRTNYACYFDEYMGMSILGWQYLNVFRDQLTEEYIQDFGWQTYNFRSYITKESFVFQWTDGKLYRYLTDEQGQIREDVPGKEYMLVHIQKRKMEIDPELMGGEPVSEFWIYPNRFSRKKPSGILYDDATCSEYAAMIKKRDRKKRIQNMKNNGLIAYIPHFFRSRRIKKFIVNVKKFY